MAGDHDEWLALSLLIDRFVSRYTNPKTSHQYRAELTALFRHVGVTHPRLLGDAAVNRWVAPARANNTRRNRLTRICVFLRWCARYELADPGSSRSCKAVRTRCETRLRCTGSCRASTRLGG